MLYEEARVYLEQVSKYGSVLGLDSIRALLKELGNPQDSLKFIHIAGTNGKGSILSYISNILIAAGYQTGAYISPTIMEYLERFQINGCYMSREDLGELTEQVKKAAERMEEKGMAPPTVFETETAIAFLFFAKYHCDVVVLETGLGGAEDATNVAENKLACVFASISRDHMGFLGDTLEEIAEVKSGIMRKGVPVITGKQSPEVLRILQKKAGELDCECYLSHPEQSKIKRSSLEGQLFSYKEYENIEISLLGAHQIENAVTAIETVEALRKQNILISREAVLSGLRKSRWPGRFEILQKEPLVIVDGAHNADAARRLAENVEQYLAGKKVTAVMGVFRDKEYGEIVKYMAPHLHKVYTVELPDKNRTLSKEVLQRELKKYDVNAEAADSIAEAIREALLHIEKEEAILVFGSLSHLGEAIRYVRNEGENKW